MPSVDCNWFDPYGEGFVDDKIRDTILRAARPLPPVAAKLVRQLYKELTPRMKRYKSLAEETLRNSDADSIQAAKTNIAIRAHVCSATKPDKVVHVSYDSDDHIVAVADQSEHRYSILDKFLPVCAISEKDRERYAFYGHDKSDWDGTGGDWRSTNPKALFDHSGLDVDETVERLRIVRVNALQFVTALISDCDLIIQAMSVKEQRPSGSPYRPLYTSELRH